MLDKTEIDRLRQSFAYQRETGKVFRKATRGRLKEGTEVMPQRNTKRTWYPYIKWRKLDGKDVQIPMQRLIWKLEHGFITEGMVIDHINGDIEDNRIENLREVTRATNSRNRTTARNNKYGTQGIHYRESLDRWIAEIRYDYDNIYLGSYLTKVEAIAARQSAELVLGFHKNHGRDIPK